VKPPISERIVRPQECVIAFAIPTSDETFKNHLRLKRDFASMYRNPGRYREHVARVYQSVEPAFRKLGVQVREEVTLQQFGQLFSGEFDVVILFAHWRRGAVEFDEGFADVSSIVAEIPCDFNGLLDLCVCHPKELVIGLAQERLNLLTKFLDTKQATPRFWLYFYLALFTHLRDKDLTYLRGVEDVFREFLKRMKSGRRARS